MGVSRLNIVWVICLITIGCCGEVNAQLRFNSEKIKQTYEMVPEVIKNEIVKKSNYKAGQYILNVNLLGERKNLVFRFNSYNELEHLGVRLINEQKTPIAFREVYDYVERIFLVTALLKEKNLLEKEMTMNKIVVYYNGGTIKKQESLSVLPQVSIDHNTSLSIKANQEFFLLQWTLENDNTLAIKVPNDYSLITGKTKDELEKDFLRDIRSSKVSGFDKTRPSKGQLKPVGQDIYAFQGEIYSTTPDLSSTKYFFAKDSISPVFNSRYHKESIRNLFLNIVPSTLTLNVSQKLYGGIDENYQININKFFAYFKSDYNIFFGWQNSEKGNLKASVLFSNKIYRYNHLLVITPNINTVFKKNEKIDGILFAYIPAENIKNTKE